MCVVSSRKTEDSYFAAIKEIFKRNTLIPCIFESLLIAMGDFRDDERRFIGVSDVDKLLLIKDYCNEKLEKIKE